MEFEEKLPLSRCLNKWICLSNKRDLIENIASRIIKLILYFRNHVRTHLYFCGSNESALQHCFFSIILTNVYATRWLAIIFCFIVHFLNLTKIIVKRKTRSQTSKVSIMIIKNSSTNSISKHYHNYTKGFEKYSTN